MADTVDAIEHFTADVATLVIADRARLNAAFLARQIILIHVHAEAGTPASTRAISSASQPQPQPPTACVAAKQLLRHGCQCGVRNKQIETAEPRRAGSSNTIRPALRRCVSERQRLHRKFREPVRGAHDLFGFWPLHRQQSIMRRHIHHLHIVRHDVFLQPLGDDCGEARFKIQQQLIRRQ